MEKQKTALVLGAGGFIGHHMVNRLKSEGYWVRGVDLKRPEFERTKADHFIVADLRMKNHIEQIISYAGSNRNPYQTWNRKFDLPFDEIYQFAADMGGAGFVFTGDNDANIMHNSATINLNLLDSLAGYNEIHKTKSPRIFYSSSACVYPKETQDSDTPNCAEHTAYPANPDSEYGWEKLFSERLYQAYKKNYGIPVCIGRFHNIFGPLGTWQGGREKSPAAICRKVIQATDSIEIWGNGSQKRSYLYIDDCIDAVRLLMSHNGAIMGPVNIGSEEMVSISQLVDIAMSIEGKKLTKVFVPGPVGVHARTSDNFLIDVLIKWKPKYSLEEGMRRLYPWIKGQIHAAS